MGNAEEAVGGSEGIVEKDQRKFKMLTRGQGTFTGNTRVDPQLILCLVIYLFSATVGNGQED